MIIRPILEVECLKTRCGGCKYVTSHTHVGERVPYNYTCRLFEVGLKEDGKGDFKRARVCLMSTDSPRAGEKEEG